MTRFTHLLTVEMDVSPLLKQSIQLRSVDGHLQSVHNITSLDTFYYKPVRYLNNVNFSYPQFNFLKKCSLQSTYLLTYLLHGVESFLRS